MKVKKAKLENIAELKNIYKIAQKHMISEGNINQWNQNEYVFEKEVINLINNDNFYIVTDNDEIIGFFAMIFGIDNTYNEIKDGNWINQDPYITIHKVAVKYHQKGIASYIFNYVYYMANKTNINNVRIDTHKDNKSMQILLSRQGFINCGIISIANDFNNINSLRLAYQKKIK